MNHAPSLIPEPIQAGTIFAGTLDGLFERVRELCEYVGGIGKLLATMRRGAPGHMDTKKSMTLFSMEVPLRLKEQPETGSTTCAIRFRASLVSLEPVFDTSRYLSA